MSGVHIPDHPLLRHWLAELRDAGTPSARFRALLARIGAVLTLAATRDLAERESVVATPLEAMPHRVLAGAEPALVPILRAGLGLLEGARLVLPDAPVGHVGLYRDEHTLLPHEYVTRLPPDLAARGALLLDPMLATGGSAVAATARLRAAGCASVRFVCVVAAPVWVERLVV